MDIKLLDIDMTDLNSIQHFSGCIMVKGGEVVLSGGVKVVIFVKVVKVVVKLDPFLVPQQFGKNTPGTASKRFACSTFYQNCEGTYRHKDLYH
ncbi:hypothetical protein CEXT_40211 [Caerostris extrusa]|uniref:Uncharacterized protein n=1 Tax=Caerostris extrusa TaxID=172846 RepID=A0AAV4UP42_CAEEX|nr:hypothetical protein CEXT_40211 [Caerostris extrusa]